MSAPALALLVVRDAVSRISPIETIEELRQLLFDLPDDIAVEINATSPSPLPTSWSSTARLGKAPSRWSSTMTPIANASAWSG